MKSILNRISQLFLQLLIDSSDKVEPFQLDISLLIHEQVVCVHHHQRNSFKGSSELNFSLLKSLLLFGQEMIQLIQVLSDVGQDGSPDLLEFVVEAFAVLLEELYFVEYLCALVF